MGQILPLFVYSRSFHWTNTAQIRTVNDKNVDSVLETRTRGSKMELIDILALIFIIRQFINFVI